jgi:hypothetical protein
MVDESLRKQLVKDIGVVGFIELVSVIAGYNCCSRMISALDITIDGEAILTN